MRINATILFIYDLIFIYIYKVVQQYKVYDAMQETVHVTDH